MRTRRMVFARKPIRVVLRDKRKAHGRLTEPKPLVTWCADDNLLCCASTAKYRFNRGGGWTMPRDQQVVVDPRPDGSGVDARPFTHASELALVSKMEGTGAGHRRLPIEGAGGARYPSCQICILAAAKAVQLLGGALRSACRGGNAIREFRFSVGHAWIIVANVIMSSVVRALRCFGRAMGCIPALRGLVDSGANAIWRTDRVFCIFGRTLQSFCFACRKNLKPTRFV